MDRWMHTGGMLDQHAGSTSLDTWREGEREKEGMSEIILHKEDSRDVKESAGHPTSLRCHEFAFCSFKKLEVSSSTIIYD